MCWQSHPTMGAWIEIWLIKPKSANLSSRTPRWVRGLKYHKIELNLTNVNVAPHDGCVDWNISLMFKGHSNIVAPHDGCVDWNSDWFKSCIINFKSHPTMGAWIEIPFLLVDVDGIYSRTPRWVRGLKSNYTGKYLETNIVAPHDGCVDWNNKADYQRT